MRLALSTNWNSRCHDSGESMLEEILSLGFDTVELGYALTFAQAQAVRQYVDRGDIKVSSVHAFCPFPKPGMHATPEPWSLCDERDFRRRKNGIEATLQTAQFAAEMGADRIVLHAGRVDVFRRAMRLQRLAEAGKTATPAYARTLARLLEKRDHRAAEPLDTLRRSLDILLPQFQNLGMLLCLENLPTADACPNEVEMLSLLAEYPDTPLRYWHDTGHAGIRHALSLMHHAGFLKKIAPHVAGFHLHDVFPPLRDHHMPPGGLVDFSLFTPFLTKDTAFVLEPKRALPAGELRQGIDYLTKLWDISR